MDVFDRFFKRSKSASTAKQRLQLVLTQDRTDISSEVLNIIKDEIVAVISKHVEIDSLGVEVNISSDENGNHLTANIPVIGSRQIRKRKTAPVNSTKL